MRYSQPYGTPQPPLGQYPRFINGNPVTGTEGSIPPATAFDEDQIEIVTVIANAGLTPDHADLTQLWQALQALFAQKYITTYITKTVHGAGADFPDLNAAMLWLGQYVITPTGYVTFMVAPGKWTYTQTVEINHPNAIRVAIQGGALLGATPQPGNMSVTGYMTATDGTNQIIYLRSVHATELSFSGGGPTGFRVFTPGVVFRYLLITGDQTVGPPSQPPSFSGLAGGIGMDFYADAWLDGCSVWGFGAIGIQVTGCTVTSISSLSVTVAYCGGAAGHGIGIVVTYGFLNTPGNCQTILTSHGLSGLTMFSATAFLNGKLTVKGCAAIPGVDGNNMAIQIEAGSQLNARGLDCNTNNNGGVVIAGGWGELVSGNISNNGGPGVSVYGNSSAFIDNTTLNGNASGAVQASGGSYVEAFGATLGGGTNIPVNTYGVGSNSFIAY